MNRTQQRFGIILPIILISYFMILLDNSIVFYQYGQNRR